MYRKHPMAIKRRIKLLRPVPPVPAALLERMGDIIAAGHGTEDDARFYLEHSNRLTLQRLQSIAAKAEAEFSWEFMHGSYKQAAELYVLASVLYERHPEHTILSDGSYDGLAKFLLANFNKLDKGFTDWYTLTSLDLKAGTGMGVTIQTPIRWMVWILTGTWEEAKTDERRNTPRLLRKPLNRGRLKPKGSAGTTTSDPVRKLKRIKRRPPSKGE